jgi:hypothetical protein
MVSIDASPFALSLLGPYIFMGTSFLINLLVHAGKDEATP